MMLLQLQNLSVVRAGCPVLECVDLRLEAGEFVGLIGPNGAGKTTLMRAALGLIPWEGTSSLAVMPPDLRARHCAWLPQLREVAWPMRVADLVALGRIPWEGRDPQGAVATALARMGVADLADRRTSDLSGGELARVLIARALAQDTPLLLADEPVAGLDPAAQFRLMRLLAELAASGRGVMAAVHDLPLAARFCTRLVMLSRGRIRADATPAEVLKADLMAEVFGIDGRLQLEGNIPRYHVIDALY